MQKQVGIRILKPQVLISSAPHKTLDHKLRDEVIFTQKVLSPGSQQQTGAGGHMQKHTQVPGLSLVTMVLLLDSLQETVQMCLTRLLGGHLKGRDGNVGRKTSQTLLAAGPAGGGLGL